MPNIQEIKHAQEVVAKILRYADDRIVEPIDESDLLNIEDLLWLLDELEVCHKLLDKAGVLSEIWKLQDRLEILRERSKTSDVFKQSNLF